MNKYEKMTKYSKSVHGQLEKKYGMKFCEIHAYSEGNDDNMPHIVYVSGQYYTLRFESGCFFPFLNRIINGVIAFKKDVDYFMLLPTDSIDEYKQLNFNLVKITNGGIEAL